MAEHNPAIQEQDTWLALMSNFTPVAMAIVDRDLRYRFLTQRWLTDYRLAQQDIIGKCHYDVFPHLDKRWHLIYQGCLAGAIERGEDELWIHSDGTIDWIKWEVRPWNTGIPTGVNTGAGAGLLLITEIVTQSKQAELTQQNAEQIMRGIFNGVSDAVLVHTLDGTVLGVNGRTLELFEVSREAATQFSLQGDYSSPNNPIADFTCYWEAAVGGSVQCFEWEAKRPHSNTYFDVEIVLRRLRLGSQDVILANVHNLTKRKRIEAALRYSESQLRLALNAARMKVWTWQLEASRTRPHSGEGEQAGTSGVSSDFVGSYETYLDGIHPADRDTVTQAIAGALAQESRYEVDYRTIEPDGSVRWIRGVGDVLWDDKGNVSGMAGTAIDVTERKRAEEALRDSEADLRYQTLQLEGTLSELRKTQSQLVQTEKMSSLGQLVAGVAHEINNPVSFIHGNLIHTRDYTQNLLDLLQLYIKHYPQPHPDIQAQAERTDIEFLMDDLPQVLLSMKAGTERIQKIVRSLRTFSRMDESDMKVVDIHEGIESTLLILQSRLHTRPNYPRIQIIKEYGQLPLIECYAGQLNQVFMNILTNAIDALAEVTEHSGWEIEDSCSVPHIRISTQVEDDRITIRIADNGPGIPSTVQQRLFDPFFTTKPVGQGTGLGLSISYQIVTQRHKGQLHCHSTPGEGTEFAIVIPVKQ